MNAAQWFTVFAYVAAAVVVWIVLTVTSAVVTNAD